MPHLSDSLTEI